MKFSKFTHTDQPTGKHFGLDAGGALIKQTKGGINGGLAVDVVSLPSLADFREWLSSTNHNHHLCAGLPSASNAKVVTANTFQGLSDTSGVITRTLEHIKFDTEYALLTIDVDEHTYDEAIKILFEAQPELAEKAHLMASSSSSHIYRTDTQEELRGQCGCHIFFHVKNGSDIPRALKTIHQRIIAKGLGSPKISADGRFLERSVVDQAMRTSCQPIYLNACCSEPLEQRKVYHYHEGDEYLDTRSDIPDLSPEEQVAYAKAIVRDKQRLKPEIERIRDEYITRRVDELVKTGTKRGMALSVIKSSLEDQELYADFVITTTKGTTTVKEILANPKRWHQVPCSDPVEPNYGSNTVAIIYSDQDTPVIHSFAHNSEGKNYFLKAGHPPVKTMPDPLPLGSELLPVDKFNTELLPQEIRGWVIDIARRVQCPIDFVAVGAMVALATLIAGKVSIYPKQKDNWRVVPNLWGCLIGRPSSMKTPAMEVLKPLDRLEKIQLRDYQERSRQAEAELMEFEARKTLLANDLKRAIKEGESTLPIKDDIAKLKAAEEANLAETPKRYVVNDSTHEKLGELLGNNPQGLLLKRDELAGLLASLNREDRQEAKAFFLEAYNGTGTYTFDRIGRGTVTVDRMILSLIGGIQPAKIQSFVWQAISQGSQDDGFLQRLQLSVYPDMDRQWQNYDEVPCEQSEQKAFNVFERLDSISLSEDCTVTLRFDEAAQLVFDDWREELEAEARNEGIHPALESHLIKYRSLMPSLALIIHVADNGINSLVSEDAALRACGWCDYLKTHMHRIYGGAIAPELINAHSIKTKRHKLPEPFTIRDIQRKNWAGLTKKSGILAALHELVETFHLIATEEKRAHHTVTIYSWHPSLKK